MVGNGPLLNIFSKCIFYKRAAEVSPVEAVTVIMIENYRIAAERDQALESNL